LILELFVCKFSIMRIIGSIFYGIAVIDFVSSLAGFNLTPFLPNEIARFTPLAFGGIGYLFYKMSENN